MTASVPRLLRLGSAAIVLIAIGVQIATVAGAGKLDLVNFLSYFTIQSNLIGVAVITAVALTPREARSRTLEWWRGAALVYLTVTFIVVILLLSNVDVGLQLGWVDFVLHKLFPIVILADFLLDPPRPRFSTPDGLRWLAYPLVWLGYTLVRGAIVGWYPYPFLNPANGGYGAVAVTSVAIVVAGAILCAAVVTVGNAMAARRQAG